MFSLGQKVPYGTNYRGDAILEVVLTEATPHKKFRLMPDGALLMRVDGDKYFTVIKYPPGATPGQPMSLETRAIAVRGFRSLLARNPGHIVFGSEFIGKRSRGRFKRTVESTVADYPKTQHLALA